MIKDNVKHSEPLQLQQMILFLKAELAKYKHQVKKYQEGFPEEFMEKLSYTNDQLVEEKNELTEELFRLNKELVKRTSDYKEQIQFHEQQSKKQLLSIDTLQQTKNDLWTTNQQLTEVVKKLKVGLETKQYNDQQAYSLHSKIGEYKTTIEQLETNIISQIQGANKHLQSKLDQFALTNYQRIQSDNVRQYLLKELSKKNKTIEQLQQELTAVKAQLHQPALTINLKKEPPIPTIDAEILRQLDQQVRKILTQSLNYEEQLAIKQLTLHALEQKLEQLTVEVDDIKIFGVSGQIVKES